MLPMAVLVLGKESARYVRSNPSYRFFAKRFFDFDLSSPKNTFTLRPDGAGKEFMHLVRQCCKNGKRAFVDEIMPDGSKVHSFINKIGDNPVTGESALIVAVLSVQDSNIGNTYSDVAKALAPGLYNSYHVDMETGDYVEYSAAQGREGLAMEVHGKDFFENAKRDAKMRIYKEDLAYFLEVFTKEKILETLDQKGEYVIRYRLTDTGEPMEVELKALRLHPKEQHLIIEVQVCE